MPSLSSKLKSSSVNASQLIIKTKVCFVEKTFFTYSQTTLNPERYDSEEVSGKHDLWIWQNIDFSSFLHMYKASAPLDIKESHQDDRNLYFGRK